MNKPNIANPVFSEVLQHIYQARHKIFSQANTALIDLYWQIGLTISRKVQSEAWGKGVVTELADYISVNAPDVKGFSDKNLWRMKQFYETYQADEKLSALVRELPWSHNLAIFSRCKTQQERAFYLKLSIDEKYSVREIDRQISAVFKDNYVLEFLGLPETHSENDLQNALIRHIKTFILELGGDFIFMGEHFRLQVGNQDFYIDLLFYHCGLSALVAFELKIGKFSPEHMGQLSFYLEALDRDVKKPHENPSIGVLLCRDKDDEVVEYALSRNLSPTLIAQYQ
ncbi:PDDEXK nuclease domain-containing protein (plasmid) [Methylomonas sp. MED-D]|uniref:PDDEXK nuclease domain-containing protein n=1 Tax=Methylomonas sp. MED-D TaxID=3418768 RepID=UPI003D057938